ncbi:hypothetical protein MTR67_039010 [Solanum verrucosum]|uniref:RNase H family protein n=1 Tax=Solanum verrucosum TaxID=315347 RepID=A0AAF0UG59_SOLVR|nr:hypothetical protein MTR67_039010 [Solanum verrucosum]
MMLKTFCWNARSINTQGSLERIQTLKKIHNLTMIVILEPFADSSQINNYRIQLNMDKAHSHPNAKIWLFWGGELDCIVLDTDEQHTTSELKHLDYPEKFITSYVYAKCKDQLRRPLWDKLLQVSEINLPWCTIGDLTVITSTQEKQGGREYNMNKSFEFISVIEACGLIDIGLEYRDIFVKAKEYEEQVRGAEEALITANTEENRISEDILQCIPRMVTQDQNQGMDKERKKYHWASWETLSYPYDEGGIGFIEEGQWKESLVRQHAPPLIVPIILNTHIQQHEETHDEAVWTPTDSAQFSISSTWETIRKKHAKDLINTFIWHKNFPFKVSFFIWRALRGKLPTNEKLASFGIEPANCYCCHRPGRDDIDHILVSGNFANHIWKVHAALLGIEHSCTTLRSLLMTWRSSQHNNEVHKLFNQALPIFICWNLWKNRCSVKYGGKQSSIGRVKYLIFKDMMQLFIIVFPYLQWPSNWKDVIIMVENCRHELKVIPVGLDKPTMGVYKLNIDGSALTYPGKIGGGGILRDHQGNLVYAYVIPLGFGTNNKTEIDEAAHGVNWCVQHGYKKIILEVDSELLSNWLNHNNSPPWQLQQHIQELKNISSQCEYFQCKHTFREANCTAVHLSKWSHRQDIIQHFYTYHQLPSASRGSYILEKMAMQNFRRKRLRRIKQPP